MTRVSRPLTKLTTVAGEVKRLPIAERRIAIRPVLAPNLDLHKLARGLVMLVREIERAKDIPVASSDDAAAHRVAAGSR
jgi:hypothetical protein